MNKECTPHHAAKEMILCVDDNEQELSVLKFLLSTNGYRVVSATNGQEAIGIFAGTAVDLVFADIPMPQMNGDQLPDASQADRRARSHDPAGRPAEDGRPDPRRRCHAGRKTVQLEELLKRIKQ